MRFYKTAGTEYFATDYPDVWLIQIEDGNEEYTCKRHPTKPETLEEQLDKVSAYRVEAKTGFTEETIKGITDWWQRPKGGEQQSSDLAQSRSHTSE